jgi:hypothetical protein
MYTNPLFQNHRYKFHTVIIDNVIDTINRRINSTAIDNTINSKKRYIIRTNPVENDLKHFYKNIKFINRKLLPPRPVFERYFTSNQNQELKNKWIAQALEVVVINELMCCA